MILFGWIPALAATEVASNMLVFYYKQSWALSVVFVSIGGVLLWAFLVGYRELGLKPR